MVTVQINAELTPDKILEAVKQFSPAELEEFTMQVNLIRARRVAPTLSPRESELLPKINAGIPAEIWSRYDELNQLQDNEALSPEGEAELYDLVNQIETVEAQRIQYLAELAQLRGQSVRELMDDLEIKPRNHA